MTQDELEWAPMYMMQDARAIRGLADEAVAAYFRLKIEYYLRGELPTGDDDKEIKKIADLGRPRQWNSIKAELMKAGFSENWRHEKWDKILKEARQKLEFHRSRAAKASAAAAETRAARHPAPAPAPAPEGEDCPF